jgi:hypothetical protein
VIGRAAVRFLLLGAIWACMHACPVWMLPAGCMYLACTYPAGSSWVLTAREERGSSLGSMVECSVTASLLCREALSVRLP